MDDNYMMPLIKEAVRVAARNLGLPEGTVFHSDRGSNYTSSEFAAELNELGMPKSVGRAGICYNNALAKSVNGKLKVEEVFPIQCSDTGTARSSGRVPNGQETA